MSLTETLEILEKENQENKDKIAHLEASMNEIARSNINIYEKKDIPTRKELDQYLQQMEKEKDSILSEVQKEVSMIQKQQRYLESLLQTIEPKALTQELQLQIDDYIKKRLFVIAEQVSYSKKLDLWRSIIDIAKEFAFVLLLFLVIIFFFIWWLR